MATNVHRQGHPGSGRWLAQGESADRATAPMPPRPGDVWRINFSRVELQSDVLDGRYVKRPETKEDNWVWSPQHEVNMHVPRQWGFVEFVGERR